MRVRWYRLRISGRHRKEMVVAVVYCLSVIFPWFIVIGTYSFESRYGTWVTFFFMAISASFEITILSVKSL